MNSLFGLSQNVFSEIKFILSSTLKKSKIEVFVFGSRATETQRQYSDLDLWIEADPPISRSELMVLSETFEDSNLPIKIDIVTPETCLDVYKKRIASEKKLWFIRGDTKKMKTISKAQHFFNSKPFIVPGDKSISHRGLLFGALAQGTTEVVDILDSGDVNSTARCLRAMGVRITKSGRSTWIEGKPELAQPSEVLDCGNSGTTIRLLMGILAGQKIKATLTGDHSLVRRPMKRVAIPLLQMGAQISLTNQDYAPVTITGGALQGIQYELKIASAQMKTAILLAGLHASGVTTLTGETHSRDHTERLLRYFGVNLQTKNGCISMEGGQKLVAKKVQVPGDPSTAAFWLAAAVLVPGGKIEIQNVSLNPTRTGFIKVLERMKAKVSTQVQSTDPEPLGVVSAAHSQLTGTVIEPEEIPELIDELPLLAVLATQAHGVTEVKGAAELRVKESDRLEALATNLKAMGANLELRSDGFRIVGPQKLHGAKLDSFDDHRIAMSFSIAGLVADGATQIENPDCVGISYPEFFSTLDLLTQKQNKNENGPNGQNG